MVQRVSNMLLDVLLTNSVDKPTTIKVHSIVTNYTEGAAMFNITCDGDGEPRVTYSWTKDGL